MQLIKNNIERVCQEDEIYENELCLDGKYILELGCGKAYISRKIATTGKNRHLVATEVDKIQHSKNLAITDLPNVRFILAGAESIPEKDESFDIVLMFKSLHHVPMQLMDKTLNEIHRVLKPNGLAYISEPIFAGDFNEVLCLFHNEEQVRKAAFKAVKNAVNSNLFQLKKQIFFTTPRHYTNFEDYENRIIKVTHTEHNLSVDHLEIIKQKFSQYLTANGADFQIPIRVDLLQKNSI